MPVNRGSGTCDSKSAAFSTVLCMYEWLFTKQSWKQHSVEEKKGSATSQDQGGGILESVQED